MKLLARRKNAVIGRVGVLLTVFFPDRRVRDLDNLLKGVLDGLVAAGVMLDDSQIHDLRVVNSGEIVTGGKIVVSVWEILE
jgi:crossover junction endodeoxyribonuclease RusA